MILRRFKFYSDRTNEEGLEQREYANFGTTVNALKRHIGRDLSNAKLMWKAGKASAGNRALSLNPKEVTQVAANTRLIAQRRGNVGVFKMYPKKYRQDVAKDAASVRPFFDTAAKRGYGVILK